MSTLEHKAAATAETSTGSSAAPKPASVEALLERASEWFNPLLVKECRQALKSRQFLATFSLVLAGAWLWSIAGIVMMGPSAYFSPAGPEMFFGYFCVLAFALLVIVPYATFRSLAGECEDRTFELVSITTLRPGQIVAGKLGSAVAQMILYLSAVAPCLAFTYLLRGIDLLAIVFTLGYLVVASFGFSTVALLLATVAREKHWQIVLSIALVVVQLYLLAVGYEAAKQILSGDYLSDMKDNDFWLGHGLCGTFYLSFVALFSIAAAAQLNFPSANRSTALRVAMLVQFLLWTAWVAGITAVETRRYSTSNLGARVIDSAVPYFLIASIYWYVMGSMMVCEQPQMSLRVKRRLPQSFLGRVVFTWFNPGPSTGYLFAIANMSTAAVVALGAAAWFGWQNVAAWQAGSPVYGGPPAVFDDRLTGFVALGLGYAAIFLGLGRLIARRLPARPPGALAALVGPGIQIALLTAAVGLAFTLKAAAGDQSNTWSFVQLSNPFSTLEIAESRFAQYAGSPGADFELAKMLIPAAGLAVFVLNLPGALREVREVRTATPKRLLEDDTAAEP